MVLTVVGMFNPVFDRHSGDRSGGGGHVVAPVGRVAAAAATAVRFAMQINFLAAALHAYREIERICTKRPDQTAAAATAAQ